MNDTAGPNPSSNPDSEDAGFKGWSACATAMRSYDEDLVKGWKEDIDTLLLLAGLFSAILTSFALQSYQLLQPNPLDSLLVYMKVVVAHMDGTPASPLSSTLPAPFDPPQSVIRVNAMWFAGLVLTLVASILGILGKQWLREYVSWRVVSPRDTVRLREMRYTGLSRWRVAEVLSLLPLLLQLSLALFLLGLLDFLWNVIGVTAVAIPATIIVSILLFLAFVSTVLPLRFTSCPYKTPLALQIRSIAVAIGTFVNASQFKKPYASMRPTSWWDVEMHQLRYSSQRVTDDVDTRALVWAHGTVLDDQFQDALVPCTEQLPPRMRIRLLSVLLAQTAGCSVEQLKSFVQRGPDGATRALYRGLLRSGHHTTERFTNLLLDTIPDVGHSSFAERHERSSVSLSRTDLFQLLHPLLGALLSGSRSEATRAAVARVYSMVMGLISESPDTSFDILLAFSTVFKRRVVREDVFRMLDATITAEQPSADNPMSDATATYRRSLVLAAPAVLHYSLFLTNDELHDEAWQRRIRRLQHMMCAHVLRCTTAGQAYNSENPQRVSWCWELRRLVQKHPHIVDVHLVDALMDADRLQLLPLSERGPLGILKAMMVDYHSKAHAPSKYEPDRNAAEEAPPKDEY